MQTAPSLQPVSRSEEVQKRDKEVSKEVTLRYFHDHDSTTTKNTKKRTSRLNHRPRLAPASVGPLFQSGPWHILAGQPLVSRKRSEPSQNDGGRVTQQVVGLKVQFLFIYIHIFGVPHCGECI